MAKPGTRSTRRDGGFGRFVRAIRMDRGQTQEQLAERADLPPDTVRRLERAEFSPSLWTLMKLCRGLHIGLAALFAAFEAREVGSDRELVALAQSLTPAETRAAVRVLAILADLVQGAGGHDGNA